VQVGPVRQQRAVSQGLDERSLFWRPEERIPRNAFAPRSSVPGTLKIDRDGNIRLELDNLLPGSRRSPQIRSAGAERFPIIGILKSSKSYVRLEEAKLTEVQLNPRSPSYQVFSSFVCIMSSAPIVAPSSRPYFSALQLPLEGYEQWLGLREAEIKATRRSVTARYSKRLSRIFKLAAGLLTFDAALSATRNDPSTAAISQQPSLTYKPNKQQTLDGIRELSIRFEDLLILLTNSERSLPHLNVKIRGQRGWGRIYFTRRARAGAPITALESWVTLPLLGISFRDIADTWLAKHEEYGPAFHLYLGCRRSERLYLEHRFVSLIWGLESLHRLLTIGADTSSADAKIAGILASVPAGKVRRWLKGKLKRAGEPSLADRLSRDRLPDRRQS
jgi:hypothetical protein